MSRPTVVLAMVALVSWWPGVALAQGGQGERELSLHVTSATSSEFGGADVGVGGRFSWLATGLIGVEAEMTSYPGELPDEHPFSAGRTEGLFGVTMGPRLDRLRVMAKVRPGFVNFRRAARPQACILIFPPPLSCVLASGRTVVALDIGGAAEVFATRRTFVRVDVGDRLLRYPGPAFDNERTAHLKGFWSHNLRLGVGGGLSF